MTLTYFTARSNLVTYAFLSEKVKTVDFSETIGLNFISLYTHVQNDNVINTNEQVSDIQNGIQKEVLGLLQPVT